MSCENIRVRFDWGPEGLRSLAAECPTLVLVDVLSFSTAVDVATGAGARVLPLRWRDERAEETARAAGAVLAARRSEDEWSLSPASLRSLTPGVLLGLASPNGATLCALASNLGTTVLAGCLRNATAVVGAARRGSGPVGVVAAGERRGGDDGPLRFAVEEALGAGAIISALGGERSAEAELAAMTYEAAAGRDLVGWGFDHDVALAAEADASTTVPVLRRGVLAAAHRVP